MSRYTIFNENNKKVVVGWDDPLTSFFAIILNVKKDEPILWVGSKPDEIKTIDDLQEKIKEFPIPQHVIEKLNNDKQNTKPLSSLQEYARTVFMKKYGKK